MKALFHKVILISMLSFLAACAGSGVSSPDTPIAIPKLSPIDSAKNVVHPDNSRTVTLSTGNSGHQVVLINAKPSYGKDFGELVYRAANGETYQFSKFTDLMMPDSSTPSFKFKTQHDGQELTGGGKLLACCTSYFSYAQATRVNNVRFGAWVSPTGAVDLFVGGKVIDPAHMPGGTDPSSKKGKITYEVLAVRANGKNFTISSYTPKKGYGAQKEPVSYSLITANFNTNKMGGTLVGNPAFGADVVLKNVDIAGTRFTGSAESAGQTGKVDGRFFEVYSGWGSPKPNEIGGKIEFPNHKHLDTVFGGSASNSRIRLNDTSTDLTPIE